MGRAVILEAGEGGQYTVELDYGKDIVDARVAAIEKHKAELEEQLAEIELELPDKQLEVDQAADAVNQAINEYRQGIVTINEVTDANKELIKLAGERDELKGQQQSLKTQIQSMKADIAELEGVRVEETRSVWCADATLNAEGEVATLEIPGENDTIIIAPGARSPTPADGRLIARGAQQAHQVWFNAAILPGWQKHKPRFMAGTITEIDKPRNLCSVEMDDAKSSANDLPIVDVSELGNVPIEYMTCNAAVFSEGDHVVVDLRNGWDDPKVIGFMETPKSCCIWPPRPELPDAGEPIVLIQEGVQGSRMVILEGKGAARYERQWTIGNDFPHPDRWDYSEEQAAFFCRLVATGEAQGAPGSNVTLSRMTSGSGGLSASAVAEPGFKIQMRADLNSLITGTVAYLQVRASFREQKTDALQMTQVMYRIEEEGATGGFIDVESDLIGVEVAADTDNPVWIPAGVTINFFIDGNADATVWVRCLQPL